MPGILEPYVQQLGPVVACKILAYLLIIFNGLISKVMRHCFDNLGNLVNNFPFSILGTKPKITKNESNIYNYFYARSKQNDQRLSTFQIMPEIISM